LTYTCAVAGGGWGDGHGWACRLHRPDGPTDDGDDGHDDGNAHSSVSNAVDDTGDDDAVAWEEYGKRFNCALPPWASPANATVYNELATLWFGSREDSIKQMLDKPSAFSAPARALTVGLFFPLLAVTFATPALPGGIFMPTIFCGTAFGSLLSEVPR